MGRVKGIQKLASGHPIRHYGQGVIDVPPVIPRKLTALFEVFLNRAHEDVSQQRASVCSYWKS